MRVVKINAIWCSGCLVMNKIWKNIEKIVEIRGLLWYNFAVIIKMFAK